MYSKINREKTLTCQDLKLSLGVFILHVNLTEAYFQNISLPSMRFLDINSGNVLEAGSLKFARSLIHENSEVSGCSEFFLAFGNLSVLQRARSGGD